jgi:hypothetical protein
MNANHLAIDCWIVSQLTGIRMLEEEIGEALASGKGRQSETLRLQIAKLKSWVSQVDYALSTRVTKETRMSPLKRSRKPATASHAAFRRHTHSPAPVSA